MSNTTLRKTNWGQAVPSSDQAVLASFASELIVYCLMTIYYCVFPATLSGGGLMWVGMGGENQNKAKLSSISYEITS